MKRPAAFSAFCCASLIVVGHARLPAQRASGGDVLFEGARLIAGDGAPAVERSALLVRNGRFAAVGRNGEIPLPPNATRVDLAGKTVMPAIVNAHVHIGYQKGATFLAGNYTRENVIDQLNRYAKAGVGAVLSLGTDLGELPFQIRAEQEAGRLGGASYRSVGRGIARPDAGPANAALKPSAYGVTSEEEARRAVRTEVARRADMIKVWVDDRNGSVRKLEPNLYRAIIDEAHALKIKVVAHIFYLADAKELARAGVDGFAHLPRDREVDDELVGLMKAAGTTQIPNLAISDNGRPARPPAWLDDPLLRAVADPDGIDRVRASMSSRAPEAAARAAATFAGMLRSLARLNASGVRLAFGTDAGASLDHFHAFADHRELALMVEAGLSPMQAIVAATRSSAEFMGLGDRLGTVAPGKSADFVVLDADPLENITNTRAIAAVYLRGSRVAR